MSDELKLIMNEITIEHRMAVHAIEVADDHTHMFISIGHTTALSTAIQFIKGKSSYLIFKSHPEIKQQLRTGHLWSRAKFIRSVGSVTEEAVKKYIEDSKFHDR